MEQKNEILKIDQTITQLEANIAKKRFEYNNYKRLMEELIEEVKTTKQAIEDAKVKRQELVDKYGEPEIDF